MARQARRALVCGAGGFIGGHLVKRLKAEGFWVRGVDLKRPEFCASAADEFVQGDLRDPRLCEEVVQGIEDVYQLAADMGGAGFVFTGDNDADIMHNSAAINLNMVDAGRRAGIRRIFYSSSACVYPEYNQMDPQHPTTAEDSASSPRQRLRLGEALQRAALSRLCPQLPHGGACGPLSQCLWPRVVRDLWRRPVSGAVGGLRIAAPRPMIGAES